MIGVFNALRISVPYCTRYVSANPIYNLMHPHTQHRTECLTPSANTNVRFLHQKLPWDSDISQAYTTSLEVPRFLFTLHSTAPHSTPQHTFSPARALAALPPAPPAPFARVSTSSSADPSLATLLLPPLPFPEPNIIPAPTPAPARPAIFRSPVVASTALVAAPPAPPWAGAMDESLRLVASSRRTWSEGGSCCLLCPVKTRGGSGGMGEGGDGSFGIGMWCQSVVGTVTILL